MQVLPNQVKSEPADGVTHTHTHKDTHTHNIQTKEFGVDAAVYDDPCHPVFATYLVTLT